MSLTAPTAENYNQPQDQFLIPKSIKDRITRGRTWIMKDANKRKICQRFERGETYWYINPRGNLVQQPTQSGQGSNKPGYRIRNTYNLIRPIVEAKVSTVTQKVPNFEVLPTANDPDHNSAAQLAEKVALASYDKWNLRNVGLQGAKLAIAGGGSAFAMVYFDPNVGPYIPTSDPNSPDGAKYVGYGEVKVKVYNGNEVFWEPGTDFEDSRWWATECAESIDIVYDYPYFPPGLKLTPDARTEDSENLVKVTEYYERPSPKFPNGRYCCIANNKLISEDDYPLKNAKGTVLDEPIIHRLVYTTETDKSRSGDFGLVWQLIDYERTHQDCWNKQLEWKNRCLNPQIMAPIGSKITRPDDEPGGIVYYNLTGGGKPEWERAVQIPPELEEIKQGSKQDMLFVGADSGAISVGPNVAATTVQAVLNQAQNRWESFVADYAKWMEKIMRHGLLLVSRYYTEPRLLTYTGIYDARPYQIEDFRGADLLDQTQVRINPSSIQPMSKQDIFNRVMQFAQLGWITPEQAMLAIDNGSAEGLVRGVQLDQARINALIRQVKDGTALDLPPRPNPNPSPLQGPDGQPVLGPDGQPQMNPATLEIPGWMPDEYDNPSVWIAVLGDWMKTTEYQTLTAQNPERAQLALLMYRGIKQQQQQQQVQKAILQNQIATQLGSQNAMVPRQPSQLPNLPNLSGTPAIDNPAAPQN